MVAIFRFAISLDAIQLTRKVVLLLAAVGGLFFVVFAESRWPDGEFTHETIELAGFCLIAFCILGRTWCSFYIGGLKNRSLIIMGPYSVCRNPLYSFSIVGAVGVGAQLGSVVIAPAVGIVTWAVFHILSILEERALMSNFGETYREYVARVPRFLPRFWLWQDVDSLTIKPNIVRATFIDACIFLVSIPIVESFDYLHDLGLVPVFFQVP